ncbi:SDR family oxidoreductase [Microvirga flavescens]|uniref:SDR family oxidoreductase n=1 Tax=Microvirga flavescens TaxID=2249811 RepID=UPI000DDB5382|nr:SDR family oxidoreductase [Microvirga flavescens]
MNLFVLGLGYSAQELIRQHSAQFSNIAGTVREVEKAERLRRAGIEAHALSNQNLDLDERIAQADAILISAPPGADGDPILERFGESVARARNARWIGYLSTTGVYGDHGGAWIDESAATVPLSRNSVQRLATENAWRAIGERSGAPTHVFRITGIYGPGRNALADLARGKARRIHKPGHVFNRIHVADIANALAASLRKPRQGAIYNIADDEPAPASDVVAYAARLAGIEPPPEIPFEEADLTPMARSFYAESKRVSNALIKSELSVKLAYPTYREGLQALYTAGEFSQAA